MKRRSRNYFAFKKGTGFFGIIPTIQYSRKQKGQPYNVEGLILSDLNNMIKQLKNTKK